ncbi:MAG TPA: hypothetical protein VFL04_06125 [Rectinemataceae bacterium]|nr:hypothetical protein [Rectinemataceae bacterium]
MKKVMVLVLVALACLPLVAQQYTSTTVGKVSTINNVDVTVSVDTAGTIILATPTHGMYIDHGSAFSFSDTIDAIYAGMKDLDGKDLTVQDYRTLGKLTADGTRERNADGIVFRLEINSIRGNKVLAVMYSTRDPEDMRFTTAAFGQLSQLVKQSLKSGADYGDQFKYIQTVVDRIGTMAFR